MLDLEGKYRFFSCCKPVLVRSSSPDVVLTFLIILYNYSILAIQNTQEGLVLDWEGKYRFFSCC